MPYKNIEAQINYLRQWRARKKLANKPADVDVPVDVPNEPEEESESESENESEEENEIIEPRAKMPKGCDKMPKGCDKIPKGRDKMPFWQFFLIATGIPILTGILSNFGPMFGGAIDYLKKRKIFNRPYQRMVQ